MAYFDWSKVVKLTDYNTIKGNKFQEISINRFLKKLEKSIDNGNDFRRCDHNTFEFWDLHETYYLRLDETLMANFDKGFYTSFTKELKRLLDKKEKMDKKKSLLELASKQSSLAEEIDKEALPLYLSEKRKDLGFSFDDIKDYFKNLKNDLINAKYDTRNALNNKIWPYNNFDMKKAGLYSVLPSCIFFALAAILSIENNNSWFLLITLVPQVILYTPPVLMYLYNYGKTRINRLINFVDRRKYAKEEIKSLIENNSEIKLITDEKDKEEKYIMLDEKTEQNDDSFEISKLILKEIGEVTNDLNGLLNESDKIRIGLKIQELLDEFNERFLNIDESNQNGQITLDGMQSLKFNMIPRIENIKREIALIKNRELIMDERMRMSLEIENNLQQIIKSKTLKKDEGNN